MFERMEISESIYGGVVEPSYKKLPEKTPTLLFTAGIREDKPPHGGIALKRARALASAENDM